MNIKDKSNKSFKNIFSLKNKVIVIFGGSGKLGINFSEILSEAGGKIYLLDIKKNTTKKKNTFL